MLSFSFTLLEFEYNSFVNERKEGIHRDIIQKVVDSSIRSTSPYFRSCCCRSSFFFSTGTELKLWMITIRSMFGCQKEIIKNDDDRQLNNM